MLELEIFTKRSKRQRIGKYATINPRGYILILETAVKEINKYFEFDWDTHVVEVAGVPNSDQFIIIKVHSNDKMTSNCYKPYRMKSHPKRGIYINCGAFLKHRMKIFTKIHDLPISTDSDEDGNYIIIDIKQGIIQ